MTNTKLHAYVAEIYADWKPTYTGKHARMYRADEVDGEIKQLRGNLSLAEEGLANAMQENADLRHDNERLVGHAAELATELERLRAGITLLTNGYKFPAECCEIARRLLAGTSVEPGAIPGEVVKCYACGQVRGYILDVQKSIGLAEEIENARRTTVEMPDDLKRSLVVALVAQGAEYCGNWPCRLLKYHTGPCSSSERT